MLANMKILYILKELFDSLENSYPYKITNLKSGDLEGHVIYSFKDKSNTKYNVYFDSSFYGSDEAGWKTSVSYDSGESLKMTDKYDIKVLSTIASITADYLTKFQPEYLEYEGVKESSEKENPKEASKRGRVYKAMIEKLKGGFPEYEVTFEGSNGIFKRTKDRVAPGKSASSLEKKYFKHFDTPFI
jgi:hypothetical protein